MVEDKSLNPSEIIRLQLKTGLSNADLASFLHISTKRLLNAKSQNTKTSLTPLQDFMLLLLADEHPDYSIVQRIKNK